jgi:hypothetical protein
MCAVVCANESQTVRASGADDDLDRSLRQPGDHAVSVPIVCVITRFGLRRPWQLLATYLDYRRVLAEARASRTPGLLRSAFLVENLTTWYSVSFWTDENGIPAFGTNVPVHVAAARRVFSRLKFERTRGPELWSTKWKLRSVSNNLNWDDFDLRQSVVDLALLRSDPQGPR